MNKESHECGVQTERQPGWTVQMGYDIYVYIPTVSEILFFGDITNWLT